MSTTVDPRELAERVVRLIADAFGEPPDEQPGAERLTFHAILAMTLLDHACGGDHAKIHELIEVTQDVAKTILSSR
jgi:hypothetical protein